MGDGTVPPILTETPADMAVRLQLDPDVLEEVFKMGPPSDVAALEQLRDEETRTEMLDAEMVSFLQAVERERVLIRPELSPAEQLAGMDRSHTDQLLHYLAQVTEHRAKVFVVREEQARRKAIGEAP